MKRVILKLHSGVEGYVLSCTNDQAWSLGAYQAATSQESRHLHSQRMGRRSPDPWPQHFKEAFMPQTSLRTRQIHEEEHRVT